MMVVWDKGPMGMGWHYRRSYETILVAQKNGAACKWYDTSKRIENIIRPGNGIPKIIPGADQHPTEKPVSLAEHFIKLHTQPGDVVVDPFCGSGTTAIAARNTGRNFIVGDYDTHWVQVTKDRLAEPYTLPMFDPLPEAPQAAQLELFESANQAIETSTVEMRWDNGDTAYN